MELITVSQCELTDVLTEMQRKYRESPELFWTTEETRAGTPEEYGAALSRYIVEEVRERRGMPASPGSQ
ncbi:hypothetical protein [Burkholderia sp. BDU5]|uniref:hypothetical protein n=1 Tax=Burkholderia sp. BDU5 TaxID=1385590 RepID=UPI000AFC0EAA|nr:hypothetical protein [Burkholderia sp. BDU5]